MNLSLSERLYAALFAFFERTGLWDYPIRAEGDLEHMTSLDKAYWAFKAATPVRRARRGSGLEELFAAQEQHVWRLPEGFRSEQVSSLSAAGDLMPHELLENSSETLYASVADLIFGADISMANLESVILPDMNGLDGNGRSGPQLAYDLKSFRVSTGFDGRRFDFVSVANNHSLDFGAAGVDATIRVLRDSGVAFHGMNERDEDAERATFLSRNGILVGIVGFTFGLNARHPPPDRPLIVNRARLNGRGEDLDVELLDRQLASCAEAGADFIVAQLHWGMEFEYFPTPEQVEVAHRLAERGVDAIVGHHPHVVQPLEVYRTRRDPDRVVPIYYSLGNLVNPFSAPFMCSSRVARIELAKGTTAGGASRTYVRRAGAHDVVQRSDAARRTLSLARLNPPGTSSPTRP